MLTPIAALFAQQKVRLVAFTQFGAHVSARFYLPTCLFTLQADMLIFSWQANAATVLPVSC